MAYDKDLSFIYKNYTRLIYGINSVRDTGSEVDELKCSKAFIVTDKGVTAAGLVEKVEKALGAKLVGKFDECPQDSGFHIVIPTTAGTGSEVTWAFVIKNWEKNQKILYGDDYLMPNTAILDPVMTQGLPPMLTATTGMDALTHAIEAIHALQAEPVTDALAFGAIEMILANLPTCVENGDDLLARGQQQIAATMAGIAFSNAQVGLVHAMAHSAGALYKVPHGMANSILLPYVMQFNLEECAERYAYVARAMGVHEKGMSDEEASDAAINAIWEFTRKLGVPQKLSECGVPEDGLQAASELTLSDGAVVYNPRFVMDADEVLEVYKKAW